MTYLPQNQIARYTKNELRTAGIIYTVGGTVGLIGLIIAVIIDAL